MLTRCGISARTSLGPASIPLGHHSRTAWHPALSQPVPLSLPVCRSSSKTDDNAEKYGKPTEDTRIHWGSSDEGWIGIPDSLNASVSPAEEVLSTWRTSRSGTLMGLLVHASHSHYRCLELTPDAEAEEIKAAYRRLSKTYHPDTTSLPLELAAEKFVRLKEAYVVLSSEEERRFYDWQLAQKNSKQQGGRSIWPLEGGKTMADDGSRLTQVLEDDIVRDEVDRLGGQNMDLSGQAQAALAFDAFAIIVSFLCIVYALFFKQG